MTELVPVERILVKKAASFPLCGSVPVLSERTDLGNEHRQPEVAPAWPADRDANDRKLITDADGQVVFTLGVQPGYVFLTEEAIRHLLRLLDSTRDAGEILDVLAERLRGTAGARRRR